MDDLPTDVDVIVLGTGLTESIVAGACSRIGKQVLHFDSKPHYGAHFASYNFVDLRKVLQEKCENKITEYNELEEGEKFVPAICQEYISNYVEELKIPETAENEEDWSLAKLEKESRRFNLDLAPRLLFARGKLVELLISSNIAKYAEFKLISRILTLKDGNLQQVPCSRADVFSTKSVNVVEKRSLMKLMTNCMDYESQETYKEWFDKPFGEFLAQKELHLTDNLRHFVTHSIAMSTPSTPTKVALEATKKFLLSLGRYGNSPFLTPIYGCGEIPQCFCRLCAVFGGIYYLSRRTDGFIVDSENNVKCIISEGKRFKARNVVVNVNSIPNNIEFEKKTISRAIVLAKESMIPAEKEQVTFLRISPDEGHCEETISVVEAGPGMMVCPKGLFVSHFVCPTVKTAKEDLQSAVEKVVGKDNIVWVGYFNALDTATSSWNPKNEINGLYTVSTPGNHLDFDYHIDQARDIFASVCPLEEFLPRAPDPEEIILDFDGQEESAKTEDKVEDSEMVIDGEEEKSKKEEAEEKKGTEETSTVAEQGEGDCSVKR